ncbi:kinase-like domain-containing protein, partial [Butyriboletus roseoflavus]
SSVDTTLQAGLSDLPDLTITLQRGKKRIVGHGSLGTVYHCFGAQSEEVSMFTSLPSKFYLYCPCSGRSQGLRRELEIWRRLDHPNIVPLLGTARGEDFGSDHPCMVSMWMPHGTLIDYLKHHGTMLSLPGRVHLIRGSVAGLEYLHSKQVVHGDFHPGNILIDDEHNPRLTDFGFAQTLSPEQDQFSYLWTDSIRPGAVMWAAPELQYPDLYPNFEIGATFNSNIYSLGSTILFILSGKYPWKNRGEAEVKSRELQNPPRPVWPTNIPDGVWNFIERCWSPRRPKNRPSAQEVMSFSSDRLERLMQPNPASDINIVLFGAVGCGKSSIINLLAEEPIAQVSADVEPCTKRPRWYQISVGEMRVRFWDTMGFRIAHGEVGPLSPYEQAHGVLRNLPDGVNLILLCASKDGMCGSLGSLYWLINDFFFGGRAPIAFVVTHLDTLDERWWERNQDSITKRTGIPVQSIPHACVTTVQTGRDQSKQVLRALIRTYAAAIPPISPCLDLSSRTTASLDLITHCRLSPPDATALVEEFSRPVRPFNVVFFGEAGVGKSSVINLIVGHPIANVSSGAEPCTLDPCAYKISTGMQQFQIWDTLGFGSAPTKHNLPDSRAAMTATQLIRHLSREGGIDLIVFIKIRGQLTSSELNCYRLFKEVLSGGKVPAALVVTHLESYDPMERWWEVNGQGLLNSIGGIAIGHACITSLASYDPDSIQLDKKLLESRLSVQAMLEDCVFFRKRRARVEGTSAKLCLKVTGWWTTHRKKVTVDNLRDRCGLTKEQAERLISVYYGSG